MTDSGQRVNEFIIEAGDRDLRCAVLQARFKVPDLDQLRTLLGESANTDAELECTYTLADAEMRAIVDRFNIAFDPSRLDADVVELCLYRFHSISGVPYLVHTGYELPLLLDGRKKLAKMYHAYPPMTFEAEDRFDYWVKQGVLHREEVLEPFDRAYRGYHGHRTVYYTPRGEEWRISATKLIWRASMKAGGWNEYFERLEGMLFGYEDWQNDWWINVGIGGGGFGGIPMCCRVSSSELAWIDSSGYRALPPIGTPELTIMGFGRKTKAELRAFMLEDPNCAAVVRFNVMGSHFIDLVGGGHGDVTNLPASRIPELNRYLRGLITVVDRREDVCGPP
jgi:hypothetical protein